MLNIAGTEYSLQTKSFDIFVSGCTRHCLGCFNPEVQDFNYGEPYNPYKLLDKIEENNPIIDNIRIMGGDLLCNPYQTIGKALAYDLSQFFPDKNLILYTGADFDEIPWWCFDLFDAIKYGRYVQELHCDNPLYGSSNQRYIRKGVDY